MRLLRSWPDRTPPAGRNYVVDGIPRLVLSDYDNSPLADIDDDVILLEWDIAVGIEDLDRFVEAARDDPSRVIVAPYRLYVTTVRQADLKKPVWCHRRKDGTHVDTGEPTCALFGFGMIYFPRELVRAYRAEFTGHFSDGSFAGWHRRAVTDEVPILWDVRPVHLHYKLGDLANGVDIRPADPPAKSLFKPDVQDPEYVAWLAQPVRQQEIRALLAERSGFVRTGRVDRVAAVDEQLAYRGVDPKKAGM